VIRRPLFSTPGIPKGRKSRPSNRLNPTATVPTSASFAPKVTAQVTPSLTSTLAVFAGRASPLSVSR